MSAGSLDLGTLHLKMRADRAGLKRDLEAAERDADQSGDRIGRNWWQTLMGWLKQIGALFRRGGKDAADGFWRDANGRLHDHKGRFVAEGKAIGEALGEAAGEGAQQASNAFGSLQKAAGGLHRGLGMLLLVIGLLAVAMVFLIPVTYALGGALAAIPAITTGGIAALATLLIGFHGLGDAFKDTTKAGGAYVDRARQIALAERHLADAQREVLDAQLALNRAREEAAEQLEDLDRSLRTSKLDELDALDAVTAAEKELAKAQKSKDPKRIDEATRAYQRAQLQLETVQDRVADLTKENDRATVAGVEGSDAVTAALERQRKATVAVEDATYDLERSHKSAGGAAVEQATKIAASAMAAVTAIKSLKGQWESLRLDIQERLFTGTDVEIKQLWAAWLPTLRQRLGSMATMFNGLFKTWADTSEKPEFIKNIATGWLSIEQLIDRVGKAIAGPGLEAFGRLSAAAAPFIAMLGDKLGGMIEHFAAWIESGEKSGALQQFFDKAIKFFGQLWTLGGDVVKLLGDFFSLWEDSASGDAATSLFDSIRNGLHDLHEWLQDPQNRADMRDFIDGMLLGLSLVAVLLGFLVGDLLPFVWQSLRTTDAILTGVTGAIGKAIGWVMDRYYAFGVFFFDLSTKIGQKAAGMWESLPAAAKTAFNAVAALWNKSIGAISFNVPDWVPGLAGKKLGFPQIPLLADGGLVKATPGGRLAVIGEGGQDEIVSPVEQMRRVVAEELAKLRNESGAAAGIHVDKLEVKAYSNRFSVSQVQRELAMHGVH